MKITPSKIMARKKPTSIARKSYFDVFGASEVFVSVVDETPAGDAGDVAGVTDGATLEVDGEFPPIEPTGVDAGDVKDGFAEDGPAVVGELGAGFGEEEFTGMVGEVAAGVDTPEREDGEPEATPAPAVATPPGADADDMPGAEPVPVTGVLAVGAVAGLIEALEFAFEPSCCAKDGAAVAKRVKRLKAKVNLSAYEFRKKFSSQLNYRVNELIRFHAAGLCLSSARNQESPKQYPSKNTLPKPELRVSAT
jgi:hypothetical protein